MQNEYIECSGNDADQEGGESSEGGANRIEKRF